MICWSCWETDCFTVIGNTIFFFFYMNAKKLTFEFLKAKPCSEMVTYILAFWSCQPISDTYIEVSIQIGSPADSGRIVEPLSGLSGPLKMPSSLHQFKIYFLIFLNSLAVIWLILGSRSLAVVISTVQTPRHMKKEL